MPRGLNKTRKWEKDRRDRLNKAFMQLSKVLPCYDPSITLSKIDILQKATISITDLDEKLKKLLVSNGNKKGRASIVTRLQDRVNKLIIRNEQLANLLRDAGITLPSECGIVKKFKQPHIWSNKFTPEQANLLQKKELEKENLSTNELTPRSKRPKVSVAPKHKTALLGSNSKKLHKRKQSKPTKIPASKCVLVFSQPTPVNPYYIISNAASGNILKSTTCSTVLTSSTFFTTPLVSSNIKPSTILPSHPLFSSLGPGTLILANGTCLPVLQPSQTILPSNAGVNSSLIVVSKSSEALSTLVSSSSILSGKKSITFASLKGSARLKPKVCLTRTTQVNKVPIPALTSKCNSYLRHKDGSLNIKNVFLKVNKVAKPAENKVNKTSTDKVNAGDKRKATICADIPAVVSKKLKVTELLTDPKKNVSKTDNAELENIAAQKTSLETIVKDSVSTTILKDDTKLTSTKAQKKLEEVSKVTPVNETSDVNVNNFLKTSEKECSRSDSLKSEEIKPQSDLVKDIEKVSSDVIISVATSVAAIVTATTTTPVTSSNGTILTSENQDLKALELNLSHSELSNDIFASLQVPSGCQNPESTSPTAAFLLAFPLVSSGAKVTEVIDYDNSGSQRQTPNLLQIGTIDTSTKPSSVHGPSESLTPSLLTLDNFSFLYEKSNKDICNGFFSSGYQSDNYTSSTSAIINGVDTVNTTVTATSNTSDVAKLQNESNENESHQCVSNSGDKPDVQNYLLTNNYSQNKNQVVDNEKDAPKEFSTAFGQPETKFALATLKNQDGVNMEDKRNNDNSLNTNYSVQTMDNVNNPVTDKTANMQHNAKSQSFETSKYNFSNYQNKDKTSNSVPKTSLMSNINLQKPVGYSSISTYQQPGYSGINFNPNSKIGSCSTHTLSNQENGSQKKCEQPNSTYSANNFSNSINYTSRTGNSFHENVSCVKYQEITRPDPKVNPQKSEQLTLQKQHTVKQNRQFPSNANYHGNVNRTYDNETKSQQCQGRKNSINHKQVSHSLTYNMSNTINNHNKDHNKPPGCGEERQQGLLNPPNFQQQVSAHQNSEEKIQPMHRTQNYGVSHSNYQGNSNENKQHNVNFIRNMSSNNTSSQFVLNLGYGHKSKMPSVSQSTNVDKSSPDNYYINRTGKCEETVPQSYYPGKQDKSNINNTEQQNPSHLAQNYQTPSLVPNYINSNKSKDPDMVRVSHVSQTYPSINYHNFNAKQSSQNYLPNYSKNKPSEIQQELPLDKQTYNNNPSTTERKIASTSYSTAVPSLDKAYTPLYTPSTNNCTFGSYHADVTNFNQQYYKGTNSVPRSESRNNYYALNYENYAGYRKNELSHSNNNYCVDTTYNIINKDKYINVNVSVSKTSGNNGKPSSSQNKPVNWMTTPSANNSTSYKPDYLVPPFSKEGEFVHAIHTNNSTSLNFVPSSTYFNSASRYTTSDINNSIIPESSVKKSTAAAVLPYLQNPQKDVDENQFSWSPSKLPQFLDATHNFVSSTLPTLVGDLALNTTAPFIDSKSTSTKSVVKKVACNNFDNQQQPNFLSVSQLVDHNNKESPSTPSKAATSRNSGSRAKHSAGTKIKRPNNNANKQESKDQTATKTVESKTNAPNKVSENCYNLNENIFSDHKTSTTSRSVGNNKNVPSSYSAEALIGPQSSSSNASPNNKKPLTISSTAKCIIPNFLTDNIISYFPPVDISTESNYMQQNNQNFQPNTFSHTNFGSCFSNNTVYSTANFIPSVSTMTTTYNFMQPDASTPEFDNLNLFSTSSSTGVVGNKDKCYSKVPTSAYLRGNNKAENTKSLCITTMNTNNNFALNTKKVSSKKKTVTAALSDAVLPNFDFPFLAVPGAINSPILPDDFHTHATFLPPPAGPYACKNPLYPNQNPDITSGALLPHPLPPPVPPNRSSGIQHHADVTPCVNTLGSSSTLANFNLSTIFPEINKGPLPEIFPAEPSGGRKEHMNSKSFPSTSGVEVPFNNKPTLSFSSYSS